MRILRSYLSTNGKLYRQIRNGYYLLKGCDVDRFSAPIHWIRNVEDISKVQEISRRKKVNFIVPVKNCTWGAGFRYTIETHPYCKFMITEESENLLEHFYRRFTPKNIFDLYLIENDSEKENKILSQPWIGVTKQKKVGEGRLLQEEGVQHYGPCSAKKISYESQRCKEIYKKIKAKGYWPQRYAGYPRGYFMVHNDKYVFQITGSGQHRTAALASLGWKYVQCSSWNQEITVISAQNRSCWPMVQSNTLTSEEALHIFQKHFSDQLQLQHKKLLRIT